MDWSLLAFGALQIALLVPYETVTNTLRRGFLFFLDTYLVFFAFSRLVADRRRLVDTIGALCLAAAVAAPMAVFESLKGWLLYVGIADAWDTPNNGAWLLRGDALRAQVSTGHSLTLGYIMAMTIGLWLYVRSTQAMRVNRVMPHLLLIMALYFSYARGPWIAAALAFVIFFGLGSQSAASFVKVALATAVVCAVLLATPLGSGIVDKLPIIGNVDQGTILYRQQLAEASWALIQQNPLFGNPFVLLNMESLRQGEGIIDLVNAYAQVALFYGLVGLALFVAVYLIALRRGYGRLQLARAQGDVDIVLLGASLIACLASNMVFIGTGGHSWLEWVLAGLLASYATLEPERQSVSREPELAAVQLGAHRAIVR